MGKISLRSAQKAFDSCFDGRVRRFTFPNRQDSPTSSPEGRDVFLIALDVSREFRNPVFGARAGDSPFAALLVLVPETAVDKDHALA